MRSSGYPILIQRRLSRYRLLPGKFHRLEHAIRKAFGFIRLEYLSDDETLTYHNDALLGAHLHVAGFGLLLAGDDKTAHLLGYTIATKTRIAVKVIPATTPMRNAGMSMMCSGITGALP